MKQIVQGRVWHAAHETQESALGAALVAVSEDAEGVTGDASCVMVRSFWPAPMDVCVCLRVKKGQLPGWQVAFFNGQLLVYRDATWICAPVRS